MFAGKMFRNRLFSIFFSKAGKWIVYIILGLAVALFIFISMPFFLVMSMGEYHGEEIAPKIKASYEKIVAEVNAENPLDDDVFMEECLPIKQYHDLRWAAVYTLDTLNRQRNETYKDVGRIKAVARDMATTYTYTEKEKITQIWHSDKSGTRLISESIEMLKVIDEAHTYSGDIKIIWTTRTELDWSESEYTEEGEWISTTWQETHWPTAIYKPELDPGRELKEVLMPSRIAYVCNTHYKGYGVSDPDYVTEVLRNNDYLSLYGETAVDELDTKLKFITAIESYGLSYRDLENRAVHKGPYLGGEYLLWPVPNYTKITSRYGYRTDPVTKQKGQFHHGLDIAANYGEDVLAAEGGTVAITGYNSILGNFVFIDHGEGYETRYGHLSKITVKKGHVVKRGDKIGEVGSTGKSTGPHLHFEVYVKGMIQDPEAYLIF